VYELPAHHGFPASRVAAQDNKIALWDAATHHGLMLKVTVRGKKIAEVTKIPIEINADCQALLATPRAQASQRLLATRLTHP
jgi:hypothetical protein